MFRLRTVDVVFVVLLVTGALVFSLRQAWAQQDSSAGATAGDLLLPLVARDAAGAPLPSPTATATQAAAVTQTATPSPTPTATRSATPTATLTDDPLPPDPGAVAPPIDQTGSTDLWSAASFLFTGNDPIQTGVVSGTIEPLRTAVLRGKVIDRTGAALPGVRVTVLNQPELGATLTRADGMFDLAVNGGGALVVNYQAAGYLPAQRQVSAAWQHFAWLPEVVLVPLDAQVTAVNLALGAPLQVARGSVVSDTDGSRQATLLFPAGVQAQLVLSNGVTQTLTTLNVRATEYTVGGRGPQAMPAELPPSSGYTYAAEFSVDEALAAGAQDVRFDRPIYTYVENFLAFPVGGAVPVGSYDRTLGQWIPAEDGRIIQIIGKTGGLAEIDVDGSGQAADAAALAALGFTDAERQQLATLYAVGASLWRVPMTHFSPWDCNWPFGPPPGAGPPPGPDPGGGGPGGGGPDDNGPDDECPRTGSIIHCRRQVLGEALPVAGAGFWLHYSSDRVPGRATARTLKIRLTGSTLTTPPPKRIDLEIQIAGRLITQAFAPAPDLFTTFAWDGKDSYGRNLVGWQPVVVRVGNTYDGFYQQPGGSPSFGRPSGIPITGSRTRQEVTLWSEWHTQLANLTVDRHSLAGWSLNVHHAYDPLGKVLYLGNGTQRTNQDAAVIDTVVGRRGEFDGTDPTEQATQALDVAVGPDGSYYMALWWGIRRVDSAGNVTTVAGGGNPPFPDVGDGGPATAARFIGVTGVALGPDGSLYVSDGSGQRIRRVAPNGIITTVAGNGTRCPEQINPCGDGGPATAAQLGNPTGLAVGADGSIYIEDPYLNRVRRVGPDGIITNFAGTGSHGVGGVGGPATAALFMMVDAVEVGPDGSVYIGDANSGRVLRVGTDGLLQLVAGGTPCCVVGEGGPATAAYVDAYSLAVGADGAIYTGAYFGRVRVVANGVVRTLAGTGVTGYSGDGGPAAAAQVARAPHIALSPDGSLYIADTENYRVRRVAPALPGLSLAEIAIPAADGSEIYVFDSAGRHLRTIHALTGAVSYVFGYDSSGRLLTVTDGAGNVTTIERNGAGTPVAITGPYGQRTTLAVDGNGYLAQVTNPAGEMIRLTIAANGLLTTLTDARGGVHKFGYSADGRLTRDEDAAGREITLARTETAGAYSVTVTAGGQTTIYGFQALTTGARRLTTVFPGGGQTVVEQAPDGTSTALYADGVQVAAALAPDPRWGMQAPYVRQQTVTTPEGHVQVTTRTRQATLAATRSTAPLLAFTEIVTTAGSTITGTYDAQTRRITTTSPAGRTTVSVLDALGRTTRSQLAGLEPVVFGYDAHGRLATTTLGSGGQARTTSLVYGATGPTAGYLQRVTDPLGRTTSFTYDAAGRVSLELLPGGRAITYTYDANGRVTGLTPPGRATHRFAYGADGQLATYTPPAPANGVAGAPTQFQYDALRRLAGITQPDGQFIGITYDGAGRPQQLSQPQGAFAVTYGASGAVSALAAANGVGLSFGYDGMLPATESWLGPVTGSVGRTFDPALRTATRSVAGEAVTLAYDRDGLLVQAGALLLSRHPAHGLVVSTTLGVVSDVWSYNGFGALTGYTARAGGATLYTVQITRDKLGRVVQETETSAGATTILAYTYDDAGRLSAVARNGSPSLAYTYDGNGNRLSAGPAANPSAASYDGQDRLVNAGATTYVHTANGAIQSKTVAGQVTTYGYDALGNLVAVTLPNGDQITYLLDGLGRRAGKRVNGVLVRGWLYDERGRVVAELDGSSQVTSRFVYGSRSAAPDLMVRGAATYRLLTNQLGSLRLVVDAATGAVAQRVDYDAYGNVTAETLAPGFQPAPLGFAGGLYDRDTKLTHFGVREYDAATGRWTARDPILFGADGTNLYAYASGDPINRRDGDGMDDDPAGGGICIFPPAPLPGYDRGPIFLDPKPQQPAPPIKPLPSLSDLGKKESQKPGDDSMGGLTLGPFKFTPKPNQPSISDLREKDPLDWFDSFDLTVEGSLYPDFGLTPKPRNPGGPDPNAPDTKPQGPQCRPSLDQPDPSGCEG